MATLEMLSIFFNNLSTTQTVLATFILLLILYYSFWQYRDVPPGPMGLPLLGYWPFLKMDSALQQMEDLRLKYGEIFSFNVTGYLYVNLCSIRIIKEAHLTKSDCFMDRFSDYSLLTLSFEDAVSIINGESWRVQRKFFQQKFKEYGMLAIKENYAGSVYDTIKETVDEMKAMKGEPFVVADLLVGKCSRIIRRILFNDQGISEEELQELNQEYQPVLTVMTHKNLLLMGNIAKYFVFPLMPSYWAMIRGHNRIHQILGDVIRRHKANFDENQIMDIIDCFYKEKRDRETKGDPSAKYFTDKSLLSGVYQFVTDGVLTIAFFIGIFLEKLAQYPEEQEKIYEELMEVVGTNRQPTMDDKPNLPYTNAFLYEVIRYSDFFPLFPSMKCTKETTINGYRIPKGAITVLNTYCAHNDPRVFEEPRKFNPSRYITVPGKPKVDLPVMFGVGKRNCMGEPLTMMETFLFVATIVKNFKLTTVGQTQTNIITVGEVKISAHPRVQEDISKTK